MKFVMNDYHRNLSEEELINDLRMVSKLLCKSYISQSDYVAKGKYSVSPYLRCFGTWINALSAAGLETKRKKADYKKIPDEILIEDMKKVAIMLNKDSISTRNYSNNGTYKVQTILLRFGSWNEALKIAKLKPTVYKEISDIDLFEEIEKMWVNKGSQPTTTDVKNGMSKYSLNTYLRRFGGWPNALKSFLDYINEEYIYYEKTGTQKSDEIKEKIRTVKKHSTPREPNLRLRFQVLKRDNFKCCICGRSPSTIGGLELQVDHIIPWSKGGETTIDNLQTLCNDCNLGKSNLSEK